MFVLTFCSKALTFVIHDYAIEHKDASETQVILLVDVHLENAVEVLEKHLTVHRYLVFGRMLVDFELVIVQAFEKHFKAVLVDL